MPGAPEPSGHGAHPGVGSGAFAGRMKRLLLAVGAQNDAELAKTLGIRHQSVSSARKREQLPHSWVTEVAERFHVSADWILFGHGPAGRPRTQEAPGPHSLPGGLAALSHPAPPGMDRQVREPREGGYGFTASYQAGQIVLVPRVLPRLAGDGLTLEPDPATPPMMFQHFWLSRKGRVDRMRLMAMHGDHMEPTLRHGDLFLLDLSRDAVISGNIHALAFGREVVIKRLDRLPERLVLHNDNKAYPPAEIPFGPDPVPSPAARVLGLVIWTSRDLA